jgi:hypothetical protein
VINAARGSVGASYALNASWLSLPTRDDVYRRWSRVIASWRSEYRGAGNLSGATYWIDRASQWGKRPTGMPCRPTVLYAVPG